MGIPIARWADRGNRVTIISVTTAIWSAAVALCGVAANFFHLLAIRIGVGIGEAGCIPPAHSLIADYFDRAERPRAVSRYLLGGPLSVVMGYLLAGWLNQFYGWRATFVLLGLPGLVLAILVRLTLREPRKFDAAELNPTANAAAQIALGEVCRTLWANTTFRHMLLCFSIVSLFSYGVGQWQPAFFARSYGLRSGELGTWLTFIYGLGGLIGIYAGGELASRLAAKDERLQLRAMALAYASFTVASLLIYLSRDLYLAFAAMAVAVIGGAAANGPLFATIQSLVPSRMRATSIAFIYLFANLIGIGLGPLAIGFISDELRPWVGNESLRYALLAMSPGYLWGAWHLWKGSHTVTRDVQLATSE
jgi:MFS family permease